MSEEKELPKLEEEEKEEVKNSYLSICECTVRQLMQKLGTEIGRSIHPDFWVNILYNKYDISSKDKKIYKIIRK